VGHAQSLPKRPHVGQRFFAITHAHLTIVGNRGITDGEIALVGDAMRQWNLPLPVIAVALALCIAPPVVARDPHAVHYTPKKTAWGDPDFQATWTNDRVSDADIPLERPEAAGTRLSMTDAEFAKRLEAAKKSHADYKETVDADGTAGLAQWVQSTPFARRTSLIVIPANGRLPPKTPQGEALFKAGRNSWIDKQAIDWVSDLDSYDRCISRGFPAAMLPWPNNNGMRVFQAPGFVVLQLEVLGTRIIPIGKGEGWPPAVRGWMGRSRSHWEGNTLVIETGKIVAGDSATGDALERAGSPVTGRGGGTVPMGPQAHAVERLTMTGPGTMAYQVTYTDPAVFTAPWTAEVEWLRDDKYQMYEFACHEGNEGRELVRSSRAQRKKDAEKAVAVAGK